MIKRKSKKKAIKKAPAKKKKIKTSPGYGPRKAYK